MEGLMTVRTRFAPSPTGFLHVGGVRTALFSWLYAKHFNGQFILRIEDTDTERSTKESVDAILQGMAWLGLAFDEGPYFQSQRLERYKEVAQKLLDEGKAYRCTCPKERIEALREKQLSAKEKPRYDGQCRDKNLLSTELPFVLRFKNPPNGIVSFKDEVYGTININNNELDDLILVRSDGGPTYNFAVVIDDWDMGITHVIRGDDHINNTPRQINLFKALGAEVPVFAHLPMILGDDGKRLSKRHGAVSVLQFKELGILPQALLNYLVRLGWSYKDQEIFSLEEMIALFNLNHVSRGVASFNYDKLYWLNQHYQKNTLPELIADALLSHFTAQGIDVTQGPALKDIIALQAERCSNLVQMCEMSLYFYQDTINYDADALQKHLNSLVLEPLNRLQGLFSALKEWNKEGIQECISTVCAQFNLKMGNIAQPLRVAVTGSSMSPSIDITLFLIGREKVIERLINAQRLIKDKL